jgi:hypothetical protein
MAPTSTVPATGHFNDLIDGVRVVDVFHFQGHMNNYLLPVKYHSDISIVRDIYLTSRPCSPHYLPSSMAPSASSMNESKENQEKYRHQLKNKTRMHKYISSKRLECSAHCHFFDVGSERGHFMYANVDNPEIFCYLFLIL